MAFEQHIFIAVDMIVFSSDNQLLLIKRGNEPFVGMWALPGGFVEDGEDLDAAASRELEEETGLQVSPKDMKQFKTYGTPGRDPRFRTVSVLYAHRLSRAAEVKGADDAAEAQWFPLDQLPALAFDHARIVEEYLLEN